MTHALDDASGECPHCSTVVDVTDDERYPNGIKPVEPLSAEEIGDDNDLVRGCDFCNPQRISAREATP